ncbi:group II intron reverse transcriptase/maturase [Streptosporangium sp. NBC_01755]|uniref:group II intron reverse transcriptase/maturase n=1 Tax=unclassified Streptosporangium TaxID=2632669 RepID=UPI002DD99B90|nr:MULTISPECIES: group II intron reverse transcriptase/maturase [unclassified Streptosporangium]WSA28375.1 group II intron reverse transcriptase/maturase [Streptosporangium sp. NBC_01810]WSD00135.1 group II intron reverse transcriptase/maturase [Streptosporangium sp. NBC_01755]
MNEPGSKPYDISKQVFVTAFEKVRSKKGAAGVDGVTVEQFEQGRKDNLYKLWNRMSSGSYFPAPVRMVEIPKKSGSGSRILGVPCVADRIAQTVAVAYLEPLVEPIFHQDSYGYRPGRSPLDAVATCRERCFRYPWAIDLDIAGFFDNLDHDLILKAIAAHTAEAWILLYVERWLKAPLSMPDRTLAARDRGSPQGASISPLIANLFMHYVFDAWMAREFPAVPFERFVDDVIVHCVSEQQACRVKEAIAWRLAECGGLQLHPDKTRIVYCKQTGRYGRHDTVSFDFLGYTFKPRMAIQKGGALFTTFSPAISGSSAKAIRQELRRMRFHLRSDLSFKDIAKLINVKAGPWAAYFGRFRPSEAAHVLSHIDQYLVRWARRKYKHPRRSPRRAWETLKKIMRSYPGLFAHWKRNALRRSAAARAG